MKAVFLANLNLTENEGIYKKIYAEAVGIGNALEENCVLITKNNDGSKINYLNDKVENVNLSIFDTAKEFIEKNEIKLLYIRHMIPNLKLILLCKLAKKKKIKVYYEIPTYPYFAEQIKTSRRKYRAIIKVLLDVIFLPIIYRNIYKMVIIKSNDNVKMYKKMIEITNGAFVENIKSKEKYDIRDDVFSMVTVGTLYNYHGYDRVLKGLKNCNESVDNKTVEFNIIGSSFTIDELKKQAEKMGLKNVKFLGIKNVSEMNELFEKFDVGLGCLALHRRNANIDTTIKIIEYYCRGIPVVTSGKSPLDDQINSSTIYVEDSENPIDINKLYEDYKKISNKDKKELSNIAKEEFSWNNIMKKLLCTEFEV